MILYDKILDVTFYRHNKIVETPFRTCNPSIFQGGTTRNPKGFTAQTACGVISFYKGRMREVFVGYKTLRNGRTISHYKRQLARGPLYVVRTMDDMKKGVTPQGNPFHSGDLVRVVENNTLWNVYVEGDPRSFYTDTEYEVPESVLTIKTPDHGKKPAMSLEVNLLPGQNCYAAVLRITNLNIDNVEIRTWERMRIIAGYRDGHKDTLDCPIFTSYIESPNPDGVTVFEGLTVGAVDNILLDKYTIVNFIQREMKITDFIDDVAKGIASNIKVNIALGKYKDKIIEVEQQKVYSQNGAATLNWLQNFISAYVKQVSNGTDDVFIQFHDGILDIILLSGEKQIPAEAANNAVNLDSITGASFSGPSLTVLAPWNPALLPGGLFYMPPNFYSGSNLPNALPLSVYRTPENLYRAITVSVSFSTTENLNKMTILALPALAHAQDNTNMKGLQMTADEYAKLERNIIDTPEDIITVGTVTKDMIPLLDDPSVVTKTGVAFIDNHSNILQLWNDWLPLTQAEYMGKSLEEITQYYLFSMLGGPRLQAHKAGVNREENYKPPRTDFGQNTQAWKYYLNSGISSVKLWYPLIALSTYWRRQADVEKQQNNNWNNVRSDNLLYVEDQSTLFIPIFPAGTWATLKTRLQPLKDIWKDAYLSYPNIALREWKVMYYYLGGTDEF